MNVGFILIWLVGLIFTLWTTSKAGWSLSWWRTSLAAGAWTIILFFLYRILRKSAKKSWVDELEEAINRERMKKIKEGPKDMKFIGYKRKRCEKCNIGIMGITEKKSDKEELWVCNTCGYSQIVYYTYKPYK